MKVFSYIEKDAVILLTLLIFVISIFSYMATFDPEKPKMYTSQTAAKSEPSNGGQTTCSGSLCGSSTENTLSKSAETNLNIPASEVAGYNALPWNSGTLEKGGPAASNPVKRNQKLLLFAALSAVFITLSFVSYYIPLRYFLKRAGFKVLSLKLYLQGFASMVIMAGMFSAVLIVAGQLMFS